MASNPNVTAAVIVEARNCANRYIDLRERLRETKGLPDPRYCQNYEKFWYWRSLWLDECRILAQSLA